MEEDVIENNEFLANRQRELEDIKTISGQIREISDNMRKEAISQGSNLNKIEDNVLESRDNAVKAEFEIKEADKEQSKGSRILCYLIIAILFVVAIIVTLVVMTLVKP